MKPNEVTVGDLVNIMNPITKEIHAGKITYEDLYYMQSEVNQQYYTPIELTDEIWDANGFTTVYESYKILQLDNNKFFQYYKYDGSLRLYWKGKDEWENHSEVIDLLFKCNVTYVHELQHAFTMCGIDKEIGLDTGF